jgi:hypothetical protein
MFSLHYKRRTLRQFAWKSSIHLPFELLAKADFTIEATNVDYLSIGVTKRTSWHLYATYRLSEQSLGLDVLSPRPFSSLTFALVRDYKRRRLSKGSPVSSCETSLTQEMKASSGILTSVIFLLSTGGHVTALQQGEQTKASIIPFTGISRAVYDDLVLYTRYSAATYGSVCPRPMGNTLVERVSLRSLLLRLIPDKLALDPGLEDRYRRNGCSGRPTKGNRRCV